MNNKRKLLFFLLVLFHFSCFTVQSNDVQNKIDSLENLLNTISEDTIRVDVLNKICQTYIKESSPDVALGVMKRILPLALNIDYKKGIADAYCNLGVIYSSIRNYRKSIKFYFEAFILYKQISNDNSIDIIYTRYRNNRILDDKSFCSKSPQVAELKETIQELNDILKKRKGEVGRAWEIVWAAIIMFPILVYLAVHLFSQVLTIRKQKAIIEKHKKLAKRREEIIGKN